jgi:hypothetical protein
LIFPHLSGNPSFPISFAQLQARASLGRP